MAALTPSSHTPCRPPHTPGCVPTTGCSWRGKASALPPPPRLCRLQTCRSISHSAAAVLGLQLVAVPLHHCDCHRDGSDGEAKQATPHQGSCLHRGILPAQAPAPEQRQTHGRSAQLHTGSLPLAQLWAVSTAPRLQESPLQPWQSLPGAGLPLPLHSTGVRLTKQLGRQEHCLAGKSQPELRLAGTTPA